MDPPPPNPRRSRKLKPLHLESQLSQALDATIHAHPYDGGVEAAILLMMNMYQFDLGILKRIISERGLKVSFSNVKFTSIAPLVGLNEDLQLRDADTFEIHRARIPTNLLREIMNDVQMGINNYGLFAEHENEEAKSRLISTFFMRLLAEFKLLMRNTPESIIEGRLTTKGRIEHLFRAFGGLTILFTEVKFSLTGGGEYLDAVAQVIAEADVCDYINYSKDLEAPVYGILSDGTLWRFFRYKRRNNPRIAVARFPFTNTTVRPPSLWLPQLITGGALEFCRSARVIIEAVFYVMLLGYRDSLQAYYDRSAARAADVGQGRKSTPKWLESLGFANCALKTAQEAGIVHAGGNLDAAERLASEALEQLRQSVENAPTDFSRPDAQIMDLVTVEDLTSL